MKDSPFTSALGKILPEMTIKVTQVDSLSVRDLFDHAQAAWRADLESRHLEFRTPAVKQLMQALWPSLDISDWVWTLDEAERVYFNQYSLAINAALDNRYRLSQEGMNNLDQDYYREHEEELSTPIFLLREVQLSFRSGEPQHYAFPPEMAYHPLQYCARTPVEEGSKYFYTVSHDAQAFVTPGFCAVILDVEFSVPAAYELFDDDFRRETAPETQASDVRRIDQLKRLFDPPTYRLLVEAWKREDAEEEEESEEGRGPQDCPDHL